MVQDLVKRYVVIGSAVVLGGLGWVVAQRISADAPGQRSRSRTAAAVEVAPVERGPIELRRTFAGTLEARSRFVVAAHVAGRVERLLVDLADPVERGQIVAQLDDNEESQGVAQAAAELSVARANLADAESALVIATRELGRLDALKKRGVVSASDLDAARAEHLAKQTAVKVSQAQLQRASAALAGARIRKNYTKVIAVWSGGGDRRVVAHRHVAAGDTVRPGDPLVTVVDLDPIDAVVHVTEREYSRLESGQAARITTDAHPGRQFTGVLRRIAPVFAETTRQARMEIAIENPGGALKPGMFVRVQVVLERAGDAIIVPFAALTARNGQSGVFLVSEAGDRALWRPVEVGIRQGDRVAVRSPEKSQDSAITGRVVTLGQQLIDDGSAITIPDPDSALPDSALGRKTGPDQKP